MVPDHAAFAGGIVLEGGRTDRREASAMNAQSRKVAKSTCGAQSRRYTGRGRSLFLLHLRSEHWPSVSWNYKRPSSIDRGVREMIFTPFPNRGYRAIRGNNTAVAVRPSFTLELTRSEHRMTEMWLEPSVCSRRDTHVGKRSSEQLNQLATELCGWICDGHSAQLAGVHDPRGAKRSACVTFSPSIV